MSDVHFPNNTQRLAIVGRTGTGKTRAGAWHLSEQDFSSFPWVVFNNKRDELLLEISKMSGARTIGLKDTPGRTGLHFINAKPTDMKTPECEAFLNRIHTRGRCGLFLDEGYVFDRYSDALQNLYTQGRSLKIPMITCSQKPKYLTPFTWSEADFFQVFHLNDRNDRKRINEFMPADLDTRLPDYHSLWYDVGANKVTQFRPVPPRTSILENFSAQLRQHRRAI